jgi:hypothetical protein
VGIIPSGDISGQFLKRSACSSTADDDKLFFIPDQNNPSAGSGWYTHLPVEMFERFLRTLEIRTKYWMQVVYIKTTSAITHLSASPLESSLPCPLELFCNIAEWLEICPLPPQFMSSDAGYHLTSRLSVTAWSSSPKLAWNT